MSAKLLLFIVAVFVLLWLLRGAASRRSGVGADRRTKAGPLPMIACSQCGVHLPRDEALPGKGGVFCGEAHRQAFEQDRAR